MVVLEDRAVVVQDGGLRAGHDVEVVGGSRVLVVVDEGCHERRQDLHVVQPVLGRREEGQIRKIKPWGGKSREVGRVGGDN